MLNVTAVFNFYLKFKTLDTRVITMHAQLHILFVFLYFTFVNRVSFHQI
jgi:hypothetical protein